MTREIAAASIPFHLFFPHWANSSQTVNREVNSGQQEKKRTSCAHRWRGCCWIWRASLHLAATAATRCTTQVPGRCQIRSWHSSQPAKKRRKKSYLHYLYIHTNPISHRLGQVRSRNNFDAFNRENIGVERKGWIDRIGVCPASSLSLSQLRVSCSHVANRTNIKFFWCFPIFKWADRYYVVFCCCSDLYEGKRRRPRTLHRDEIPVGSRSLSRGILCRKFPLRLTVWITIADATDFWPLRTGRRLFFPFRYHLVSKTCRPCQSSLRLLPEDWQRRRKTLQKTSSTCSFFWIASRSFLLETRTVWRWPNN